MIKKEITFNAVLINILGIAIIIPVMIMLGFIFKTIHPTDIELFMDLFISNILQSSMLFILFYITSIAAGIIGHELLHGIVFAKFSVQGFKNVKFGFNVKAFAPYAHCKVPLEKKYYILALALPGVVLGIAPAIIALIIGNVLLYAWSLFFILAAVEIGRASCRERV